MDNVTFKEMLPRTERTLHLEGAGKKYNQKEDIVLNNGLSIYVKPKKKKIKWKVEIIKSVIKVWDFCNPLSIMGGKLDQKKSAGI